MIKALIVLVLFALAALAVFVIIEAVHAPLMPQSWQEDTGDYIKCKHCDWDTEYKDSIINKLSDACLRCPYCYRPESDEEE